MSTNFPASSPLLRLYYYIYYPCVIMKASCNHYGQAISTPESQIAPEYKFFQRPPMFQLESSFLSSPWRNFKARQTRIFRADSLIKPHSTRIKKRVFILINYTRKSELTPFCLHMPGHSPLYMIIISLCLLSSVCNFNNVHSRFKPYLLLQQLRAETLENLRARKQTIIFILSFLNKLF